MVLIDDDGSKLYFIKYSIQFVILRIHICVCVCIIKFISFIS